MWRRSLDGSIVVMMAGSKDDLPLRRVGPQWHWWPVAIKRSILNHPCLFCRSLYVTEETLVPIWPMLQNLHQYALCRSVETVTDSLMKGVVIMRKGGGRGER